MTLLAAGNYATRRDVLLKTMLIEVQMNRNGG